MKDHINKMKNKIINIIILLLAFLPSQLSAQQQDITGIWNGELIVEDSVTIKLPFELAISENKGNLIGYSRIIFTANGKEEAGIQDITLKWKGDKIIIEDEGFIEHAFTINPSKRVKKTMTLTLTVTSKKMILEGNWSTNRTRYYNPAKGTALLTRNLDLKTSVLYQRLDTLKIATSLVFHEPKFAPEPVAVAIAVPEKKPAVIIEPVVEHDLMIPAIQKATTLIAIPILKNRKPAIARVLPLSPQKKLQFSVVTKMALKPTVVAVITAPKPQPVVAVVTKPVEKVEVKPQPKPAPVNPIVAETKPIVQPVVKPAPAPVAVVAPSITKGAAELDKRITKSEQSVYFESDSLLLTLYDNGEVDGDTVTVVMNGNVIFSKAGLTTKPNSKTIYIDKQTDSVNLIMYAETLGEIPPNTGLMIVIDGEKRYEIRFSADLKTNAGIIFRRRKIE